MNSLASSSKTDKVLQWNSWTCFKFSSRNCVWLQFGMELCYLSFRYLTSSVEFWSLGSIVAPLEIASHVMVQFRILGFSMIFWKDEIVCPIVFNDLSKQELFCLSDNTSKKRIVLFFFKLTSKLSILIWISLRDIIVSLCSCLLFINQNQGQYLRERSIYSKEKCWLLFGKKCLGRQAGNSRWRRLCHIDSKFPLSSYWCLKLNMFRLSTLNNE